MKLYECVKYKYSLTFKLNIVLYIVLSIFSLGDSYTSMLWGGVFLTLLHYIPVLIILIYIVNNQLFSRQIKYNMYIWWIIPFLFIYFVCFEVIAAKDPYSREIMGINLSLPTVQMINVIPVFFVSWYILQRKDVQFNSILALIIVSLFIINFLLTLMGLKDNPEAARILATGFDSHIRNFSIDSLADFLLDKTYQKPCGQQGY